MECCLLIIYYPSQQYKQVPYQSQLAFTLTKVAEYLIIPPPLDGRSITSRLFIPTDHIKAKLCTRTSSTASELEMSSPTDQTPGMSSGGGGERRRVSAPPLTVHNFHYHFLLRFAPQSTGSSILTVQSSASATKFAGLMNQKRNSSDVTAAARKASFAEQNNKPGLFGSMWQR